MYQKGDGYKVLACNSNSYGSPNIIYGRGVSPCRSCPTNMVTDTPSVVPGVSTATGHISPLACKTQAGYGYDGVVSTQVRKFIQYVGVYSPSPVGSNVIATMLE